SSMMNRTVTEKASTIGKPDSDGILSTSSKWPSRTVVAGVSWPWSSWSPPSTRSQFGYGLDTLGTTGKLYGGGGELVVHSRVPPKKGSGPDGAPRNRLQSRLPKIISNPNARMKAPTVSDRLEASQPKPAWYVSTRRVIQSRPRMCIA